MFLQFAYACISVFLALHVSSSASAPAPKVPGAVDVPTFDALFSQTTEYAFFEWMVKIRRELHQIPELGFHEHKTSAVIQRVLTELGVKFTTGWGKDTNDPNSKGTGVVAEIGTGQAPCVALRADMDALPLHELAPVPFKSTHPGHMHACGHDSHMAMLLGAARLLVGLHKSQRLPGTVRLVFQPAEEGGAGGLMMRQEGVLERQPVVERMFGLHVWPTFPSGSISGRPGTIMAAVDMMNVTITGQGGHGAMPEKSRDPITTAAAVITSLQLVVSRETSPLEAAVVTVGAIHAGSVGNVIPDTAELQLTARTVGRRSMTSDGLQRLVKRVEELSAGVAKAHRCSSSITRTRHMYPPVVNNPQLWPFVTKVAGEAAAAKEVVLVEPTMGGEDFAYFAEKVPSAFLLLGSGSGRSNGLLTNVNLHNPNFVLDEDVMKRGAALHVHLALQSLVDLGLRAQAKPRRHEDL